MKSRTHKMLSFLIILIAGLSLKAQVADPSANLPSSLASTMKRMSSDLKRVASQVNNSSANADSEKLANDYVTMALHAKDFTPDSIAALPKDQQKAQKESYDLMLDNSAENGKSLAQAFHENNNAKAIEVLNLLSKDKKDGHAKFKN